MKFGDTLYQRSIPQWAPYNVDYNSLKRLIKSRTTDIATVPVAIPGQGPSTEAWHALENELFPIFYQEHYRCSLFIRSKFGEIDRRLAHVEKQARLAEERNAPTTSRPIQQTAKYQRLVEEADKIGNDIQSLSRFASAQRLAFRKILKKYRKWTGSSGLQIRMTNEVLGQHGSSPSPEFDLYLSRLAKVTSTLGQLASSKDPRGSTTKTSPSMKSRLARAGAASLKPIDFESAFAMPSSFPKVTYWIHRDDLDEAKVLLMRRMRLWEPSTRGKDPAPKVSNTHIAVFGTSKDAIKPDDSLSGILTCRWTGDEEAFVADYTNSQHRKSVTQLIPRKKLSENLQKKANQLEPLAMIQCQRERFIQDDTEDPVLATLKTNITIAPLDAQLLRDAVDSGMSLETPTTFPHAVLTICHGEMSTPEVISAFDKSHLAQVVPGFSLESQAIYVVVNPSTSPSWKALLDSDIRKTPAGPTHKRLSRTRIPVSNSSGPSSTEGPAESIYSQPERYSSNTSIATITPLVSPILPKSTDSDLPLDTRPKKQRKRKSRRSYGAVQEVAPQRYWNEFDDEPEFNNEGSYTIYVTPDEPFQFPGTETISNAIFSIGQTLKQGKSKLLSWTQSYGHRPDSSTGDEQARLLDSPTETIDGDIESSSDDQEMVEAIKSTDNRRHRTYRVTSRRHSDPFGYPRRRSRDQLLSFTAAGLHILSLLILLLATVLKSTGRKKAAVEVDAGVITGIVVALGCGVFAIGCAIVRRAPVSMSEWVLVSVLGLCEFVWGICLGIWVAEATTL